MGRGQKTQIAREYRRYTDQQITEALDLVEKTDNILSVSKALNIDRSALRYWIQQYETAAGFRKHQQESGHRPAHFRTVKKLSDSSEMPRDGSRLVKESMEEDYAYILGIYLGDGYIDAL